MLFVYVLGIPAAAVLKLWLNRKSGAGLTRAELAARDGPLVTLTRKYSPQYWWFEAVCIGTRLCFCGLAVFFFPGKPVLRLALCLIAISFNIWFCERCEPAFRDLDKRRRPRLKSARQRLDARRRPRASASTRAGGHD